MLGIRKIDGLQVDLYVGDYESFLCDAYVFLKDRKNPRILEGFPSFKTKRFHKSQVIAEGIDCYKEDGADPAVFSVVLIEGKSLSDATSDLFKVSELLKTCHMGLDIEEYMDDEPHLKREFLHTLNIENKPRYLRRLTLIFENTKQYKNWQESFWNTLPETQLSEKPDQA